MRVSLYLGFHASIATKVFMRVSLLRNHASFSKSQKLHASQVLEIFCEFQLNTFMRVWFLIKSCEYGFGVHASLGFNQVMRVLIFDFMRVLPQLFHASLNFRFPCEFGFQIYASFVNFPFLQVLFSKARKPRSPSLVTDPSSFIE